MKVVALVPDLLLASRIEAAAAQAGADYQRTDDVTTLPRDADLVLVDWSARLPGWTDALAAHPGRVILFGPHTDLDAHAAAREAGMGPMWARSRLVTALPDLLGTPREHASA